MERDAPTALRVDDRTVRRFLDRLDSRACPSRGMDRRLSERFDYRVGTVTLGLCTEAGTVTRHLAASRNISRQGVGVLAGQFIYPGTPCRVTLRGMHGRDEIVAGRVVRCHYLSGSASLYDVGMQLDRVIDAARFTARARTIRVLLVDQLPAMHDLVASFVEPRNVKLSRATTALDAAAAALAGNFDLILLDLENASLDPFSITDELRRAGYLGPIVGLAVETGQLLDDRCRVAGCTGYLQKPLTRQALLALVDSLTQESLFSSLDHDAAMARLINDFVGGLRERAGRLSAAFEAGDLDGVHRLARELRAHAGSYGFETITEEAQQVQALVALEASPARLRSALYDLIHLCLCARPASGDEGGDFSALARAMTAGRLP